MKLHHYKSEYGDWHFITEGEDPVRVSISNSLGLTLDAKLGPAETYRLSHLFNSYPSTRISPPPYESERFWIQNGEWRQNPARKMSWDREGIHAAKGAAIGASLLFNLIGIPLLPILALIAILAYVFIRYEETEESEIDDRAYRDIGGWLIGFMPAAFGSLLLIGLLG